MIYYSICKDSNKRQSKPDMKKKIIFSELVIVCLWKKESDINVH